MKLYFLTVLTPNDSGWGSKRNRCWGYFESKYEAEQALIKSPSFLSEEMYFTHAVIEELEPGLHTYDLDPSWFEFRRLSEPIRVRYEDPDDETGQYDYYLIEFEAVGISAPEWSKNIVGWAIG